MEILSGVNHNGLANRSNSHFGRLSILVADEYESSLMILDRLITTGFSDITVHFSCAAKSTLDFCISHDVDMVISAINERICSVISMIESVKIINHNTKFIIMTCCSENDGFHELSKLQNVKLLAKPVDLTELMSVIKENIADIESRKKGAASAAPPSARNRRGTA
jgi:response regulator RpfG family c-di-GMP phosphodiesterase